MPDSDQRGVSLLEIIVVIALIGIVVGLVKPNLNSWKANATVKSDFNQLVASIEYLKSKARAVNGTAVLICNKSAKTITYAISSTVYSSVSTVPAAFSASETVENTGANILSGKSTPSSTTGFCNSASRGIFLGSGQVGLEGGAVQLDMEINFNNDKVNYDAYRVVVYQTTGFLQKQRWNKSTSGWVDFE